MSLGTLGTHAALKAASSAERGMQEHSSRRSHLKLRKDTNQSGEHRGRKIRREPLDEPRVKNEGAITQRTVMSSGSHSRNFEWLRADFARNNNGRPPDHFYCPMLMRDEKADLLLGHVVNEKFKVVPEFKIQQRQDIDNWYGSMFEGDFLTLMRHQEGSITDLFEPGNPPPRGVRPVIKAGGEEIRYYPLKGDDKPINEHTLMEINAKNGAFMRLALKKSPKEVLALRQVKWHSEVFADFRIAALVSLIKAAYLTLFWKLGYKYTLSAAGLSVGHDILGRFFLDNKGKSNQEVQVAAKEFFAPYINMLRPAEPVGENAPRGTIEDSQVFVWLGSSGHGLGIGVFVRTNHRLHCVLMPGYSDSEGAETYLDFLRNPKEELWVREGQYDEERNCWDVYPDRIVIPWPKLHKSFDLSQSPQEILKDRFHPKINREEDH
jgi:hypothetical protein